MRATGGELHTGGLPELRMMVERRCYHVFQPDAVFTGGIAQTLEVARLCKQHGLVYTPHTWTNGFGFAVNLQLMAALHHLGRAEAKERIEDLLARFELTEAAPKHVATYSGGMKRRLDLASALVHEPDVLFLDEPTTGLDPASRITVWDEVRRINERGTTVFLTTQYLEEADQLCDRLAIIDGGQIVERGGGPADLVIVGDEAGDLKRVAADAALIDDSTRAALEQGETARLRYYAFDLLARGAGAAAEDLRGLPLLERKAALKALLRRAPEAQISYVEHFAAAGEAVLRSACRIGLEGVVSKRADAPYRSGRGGDWVKAKCRGGDEFVVGGYSAGP